jgi:hypothetical protein
MPVVLGPALSMQAIHGGKAKHDTIAAHTMAVLLRGGRRPPASVSPAARRATRARLRRRRHRMRKRAALLTHSQTTTSPYHLPEIGQQIAYKAHRAGVAARCAAPAGHKRIAVDLALMSHDDSLLRALELAGRTTATAHPTNPRYWLRTGPGIGELRSLVLRYAIQDLPRCPRGQDLVADGRLVNCAQASAGKRYGPGGTKLGRASLTWACSAAAGLFVRDNPAGPNDLRRVAKTPGQGKALTVLAPHLARAVYDLLTRAPAFTMAKFIHG